MGIADAAANRPSARTGARCGYKPHLRQCRRRPVRLQTAPTPHKAPSTLS